MSTFYTHYYKMADSFLLSFNSFFLLLFFFPFSSRRSPHTENTELEHTLAGRTSEEPSEDFTFGPSPTFSSTYFSEFQITRPRETASGAEVKNELRAD